MSINSVAWDKYHFLLQAFIFRAYHIANHFWNQPLEL